MSELQIYASCDISLNYWLRPIGLAFAAAHESRRLLVDLSFRLGPYTDVFGEIVECRACWLLYQLKDLLIAFPSSDIGLGVSDVQDHLQMVVVHATVAFFHSHLVAVRGAVLVKPSSVGEVVRVDDKRVSLPVADGVSVPT